MWFSVVAPDAMPCRGDSRWKATCLQPTSAPLLHDHTPHRPHNTTIPPCDQPSFFSLKQENNLRHHGWRSHDYVDPDTETKCDSCFAWSDHLILCTEVITHAEGSQKLSEIQPFSRCEVPAMMVRTSFVQTRCATKQVVRLLWKLRVLRETAAFRRTRGNHPPLQRAPLPAAEVLKL